jgi:hypothetical protein
MRSMPAALNERDRGSGIRDRGSGIGDRGGSAAGGFPDPFGSRIPDPGSRTAREFLTSNISDSAARITAYTFGNP